MREALCQDTVVVKSEFKSLSKNDLLSFRLTQIESDPKNPQADLTPERNIDYRFEDPVIRIENSRYKTLAHLKENDCWDT